MSLSVEPQLADHHHAFSRHLQRRIEALGRRLHRFIQDRWDINALAMLQEEAADLGQRCDQHGLAEMANVFGQLRDHLAHPLQAQTLPDAALNEQLWSLLERLGDLLPQNPSSAAPALASARAADTTGHAEVPPAAYWRRWGDDAPPLQWPAPATAKAAVAAARASAEPVVAAPEPEAIPAPAPVARPAALPALAASTIPARIYHLTQHGPLSLELDQRMESHGWEVELLESGEELQELLGALPADLVLVDAAFSSELESFGQSVRQARLRSSQKVLLVALSEAEDIGLRLSARRAGVDALIVETGSAIDVLKRLQGLLDPNREAPYRILVVEDDRGQALFAEGVLRNAGMETRVVMQALDVMPVLQAFHPDLILMDLHMPGADGIELTTLIREQDEFLHTPIVFLSGESDADRQFDALDAGGDDFLAKPIRPRHLIASVQSRVRRTRALAARSQRRAGKDAVTGLYSREELLEQVDQLLVSNSTEGKGGLMFLEVDSIALLRDKFGLSALEQMLTETARLLVDHGKELKIARFGDGSFVILDLSHDETGLDASANQLRHLIVQHPFNAGGHDLRLRVFIGVAPLRHRFAERGILLNTVERMAREARSKERCIALFVPAKNSELTLEEALINQIRDAVAKQRLELLFQPVVAVAGSDESQYQVLLRLRQEDGKLIPAGQVVPLAERGDFIVDIDRWVMMRALTLIQERRAEGRSLRLFVTQSALTMADPGQVAWLKTELVAHDIPGESLVMEIRLEDALLNGASLAQFCNAIASDGVQICLSQYENSREAEALLAQLPLSFIKLARKYTGGAHQTMRDELKQVIERAHRHGLEVIGHGVEDAQAAATLWMSGIDYVQGNLVQQAETSLEFDFQQAVL